MFFYPLYLARIDCAVINLFALQLGSDSVGSDSPQGSQVSTFFDQRETTDVFKLFTPGATSDEVGLQRTSLNVKLWIKPIE